MERLPGYFDYVLFCAAVLLIAYGFWYFRHRHGSLVSCWQAEFWTLLLLGLGAGWFAVEHAGEWQKAALRRTLAESGRSYARTLERLGHSEVSVSLPEADSPYASILEKQQEWLLANPGIGDVSTMRRLEDERILTVVDAMTDSNGDGMIDPVSEARLAPGSPVQVAGRELGLLERAFRGEEVFDDAAARAGNRSWVTGYFPLYDKKGEVEAVLAVAHAAGKWAAAVRGARSMALGTVAALFIAVGGVLASMRIQRARLRAERENLRSLREKETLFSNLFQGCPDAVYVFDSSGGILEVNPAACALHALQESEMRARNIEHLVPERCRAAVMSDFFDLVMSNRDRIDEALFANSSGREIPVEIRSHSIEYRDELSLVLHVRDLSEVKKAAERIKRLAAFPGNNPHPVIEFDARGKITFRNAAAEKLAMECHRGMVTELLPPNLSKLLAWSRKSGERIANVESTLGDRTFSWSFFPDSRGKLVQCYGVELTRILQLESKLQRVEKTHRIGKLAASVGHEFNNQLTVIDGNIRRLIDDGARDPVEREKLKEIECASRKIGALTRQLLAISHKQHLRMIPISVNKALENTARLVEGVVGERVSVSLRALRKDMVAEADRHMLTQVVLNLCINAAEAMPGGGEIKLSARRLRFSEEEAQVRGGASAGVYVAISVEDEGCGMDQAMCEKIFEPCYSTKEDGAGAGLGLPAVYAIISRHGGWIDVVSKVGRGSTFTVYLKGMSVAAVPGNDDSDDSRSRGGRETILLVEDEPALLKVSAANLEKYGYRVIQASDGSKALELWSARSPEVDVLLTDIVMPGGISGADLGRTLQRMRAELPVLYVSGYSEEIAEREDGSDAPFLPKPYRPEALAAAVRRAIDRGVRPG